MKRVLFYVDSEWSMGRFHFDLAKFLFRQGIDSQILNYSKSYTWLEIQELSKVTDYFISNGSGVRVLIQSYQVPPEKCIAILLHPVDIEDLVKGNIDVSRLHKIATVAEWIKSRTGCFNRTVQTVKFGINTNIFKCNISDSIKTIGYAAAFHTREETEYWRQINVGQPKVSKRGYLVSELAQEMNLPFYSAHPTRQSFVTMPGFYNAVDVIVCSSSDEGAGGPVLEGGAAGRLIITTATGGFSDLVTNIGADVVPVEDNLFKQEAKRIIQFYIDNPVKYRERCKQIQDYAIETYDLSKAIDTWVNLITN